MSIIEPTTVALRESLEAFLLVSIFAGLVVKLGHRAYRKYLLWGAGSAVVASIVGGVLIDAFVRELFDRTDSGAVFEGVASLVAVAILTYMIVWMYRHTLDMVHGLHEKTRAALAADRPGLLFTIAFVAVAREGLETVFFFASQSTTSTPVELVLAALLGVALSGILAFLVFAGIVQLNIKKFFATTGILLIFFAGGLLMTMVHEFSEVGLLPETAAAWNTHDVLSEDGAIGSLLHAVFGYRESPTILEAAAYFLYVLGLGAWYVRGFLRRNGPVPAALTPGPETQSA